jgi:hypothetical protein
MTREPVGDKLSTGGGCREYSKRETGERVSDLTSGGP